MKNAFPPAIQLYSVREQLAENPRECLAKLTELGFSQAEGYDLLQLSSIKPLLDEFSIEVKSSFLLWSHITERYDLAEKIQYPWIPGNYGIGYAIDNALELCLDTVVCGYLLPEERQSLDCYKRFSEQLNVAGEKCREAGLSLLYHNHCFEFKPFEDNSIPYHYIIENTDPKNLNFEVDVLWCELAGHRCESLFSVLDNRLKQLHLKTGSSVNEPIYDESLFTPEQQDFPLGKGFVDIRSILDFAGKLGLQRAYIEQEHSKNIYQSLAASLDFLQS